jgi:hypothetical protein
MQASSPWLIETLRREGLTICSETDLAGDTLEDRIIRDLRGEIPSLIESERTSSMPAIQLVILDSTMAGAYALEEPGGDGYVALTRGMVWIVYDLAYRMLKYEESAKGPGDVEVSGMTSVEYQDLRALGVSENGSRLEAVKPHGVIAVAEAEEAARLAIDFLVLHELGHIRHGHFGYGQAHGIPFIAEFRASNRRREYEISQALEMDADSYALCALMVRCIRAPMTEKRHARLLAETLDRLGEGTELSSVDADASVAGDALIGAMIVFLIFGLDTDLSVSETDTHPPTPYRLLWGFQVMRVWVGQHFGGHEEQFLSAVLRGRERFRHRVTPFAPSLAACSAIIRDPHEHERYAVYSEKLKRVWSAIRPEVLGYSHVPGLAP